jgi:hypothetical protein
MGYPLRPPERSCTFTAKWAHGGLNCMDLQHTFEQLPVGVGHSDRAGRILKFNATFCTMLGFEAEELTGKMISSPGCLCLGATIPGSMLTRAYFHHQPSPVCTPGLYQSYNESLTCERASL